MNRYIIHADHPWTYATPVSNILQVVNDTLKCLATHDGLLPESNVYTFWYTKRVYGMLKERKIHLTHDFSLLNYIEHNNFGTAAGVAVEFKEEYT